MRPVANRYTRMKLSVAQAKSDGLAVRQPIAAMERVTEARLASHLPTLGLVCERGWLAGLARAEPVHDRVAIVRRHGDVPAARHSRAGSLAAAERGRLTLNVEWPPFAEALPFAFAAGGYSSAQAEPAAVEKRHHVDRTARPAHPWAPSRALVHRVGIARWPPPPSQARQRSSTRFSLLDLLLGLANAIVDAP